MMKMHKIKISNFVVRSVILLILSLFPMLLFGQDVYLFVAGKKAVVQQTGDEIHQYDFLIEAPDNGGEGILEIFDAAIGGNADVRGYINTSTTFQLFAQTSDGSLELRKSVTTESESKYLQRWIPLDTLTVNNKCKAWLLRTIGGDGDGVNAFKIRVESLSGNESWKLYAKNLPVCINGLSAYEEAQFCPATRDMTAPLQLVVKGAEGSQVVVRDSYGKFSHLPVDKNFQFDQREENEWGIGIAGSAIRVNNLVITTQSSDPILWNINPIVVHIPTKPKITIEQVPDTSCLRMKIRLNEQTRKLLGEGNPKWTVGVERYEGDSIVVEFPKAGTYAATVILPTRGLYFPKYWVHDFSIHLNEPPVAKISVAKEIVSPNEVVTFSATQSFDPEQQPLKYEWFVNGEYRGNQPFLRFFSGSPGKYEVKLVVYDGSTNSLCNSGTALKMIRVNSQPYGEIQGSSVIARATSAFFSLHGAYDPDGDSLTIRWDGIGIIGSHTEEAVQVLQEEPGVYILTATLSDGTGATNGSYATSFRYRVNAEPHPAFTLPSKVAPGDEIILSAKTSFDPDNPVLKYFWKVSDGSELSSPVASLSFEEPGTYSVSLIVDDGEGVENSVQTLTKTIKVNAPPVPVIIAPEKSNLSLIHFSAEKSWDADQDQLTYRWNFGDDSTAVGKTVSHLYQRSGTYTVTLTVNDGNNLSNSSQFVRHTITINKNPKANFDVPPLWEPQVPLFVDGSQSVDSDGSIVLYQWFINGKEISNESKTSLEFPEPGDYTVTLQVKDNSQFDDAIGVKTAMVHVNFPPNVRYTFSPSVPEPNEIVTFDARGSNDPEGKPVMVTWKFPDDSTFHGSFVRKRFSTSGTKYVQIIVDDGTKLKNGVVVEEIPVLVNNPPMLVTKQTIRSNERRIFLDASQSYDIDGQPLTFDWVLPDGTHRNEASFWWQAPSAGTHVLTVGVNDGQNKTNSIVRQTIRVNINRPPVAIVDSSISTCVGQVALFNSSKCYDPDNDAITTHWDFGDNAFSDETNPAHTYTEPGIYLVKLMLSDGIVEHPPVVTIPVFVETSPHAIQSFSDTTVCANVPLTFDGSQSVAPKSSIGLFTWDFGDGTSAFGKTVSHVYTKGGAYTATLTVLANGSGNCTRVHQATSVVHVVEGPIAAFSIPSNVNINEIVELDGTPSTYQGAIRSVRWLIDGQDTVFMREGMETQIQFSRPGVYSIQLELEIESSSPCSAATAQQQLQVNIPPRCEWSIPSDIALGDALVLDASRCSDSDGSIVKYEWQLDGIYYSSNSVAACVLPTAGKHTISLTIQDNSGTSSGIVEETKSLYVNAKPDVTFDISNSFYEGEEYELQPASLMDSDGDTLSFIWKMNDEALSSTRGVWNKQGTVRVTLVADDKRGLRNSIDSVSRIVQILPVQRLEEIDVPVNWIVGSEIKIQEVTAIPNVGFIKDAVLVSEIIVEKGSQTFTLGWSPKGKILKERNIEVVGWEPLVFIEEPQVMKRQWNPSNPAIVLTAPKLNRPADQPIKIEWFSGQMIIGYGNFLEVPLRRGNNVFRVRANDQNVKNSLPCETNVVILCE